MAMNRSKMTYKIDLRDFTDNTSKELSEEVGELLLDKVLEYASKAKSPVDGESWKSSLSKKYKKFKAEESSSTIANMELNGDLLDALEYKATKSFVEIGIFDEELEMKKLDGHGHYNVFGLNPKLPQRRLLPAKDQKFKNDILKDVKALVKEYGDN